MNIVIFGANGATGKIFQQLASDQYSRKVMAVATFSVQPSMLKFLLQEAFKEPSKS